MTSTFDLLRADGRSIAFLVAIFGVVILLVPFLIYLLYAPLNGGKAELLADGLKIHYPFYGRTIAYTDIGAAGIQLLEFAKAPDKEPKLRTNGIGLPGYMSGWFRLRNGDKALLFVANKKNVIEIPTTLGFVVQMSVAKPDEFLAALRARL